MKDIQFPQVVLVPGSVLRVSVSHHRTAGRYASTTEPVLQLNIGAGYKLFHDEHICGFSGFVFATQFLQL